MEKAFPIRGTDGAHLQSEGGLSKREYFAALAMQGIIAGTPRGIGLINNCHEGADLAVEWADALIEALKK